MPMNYYAPPPKYVPPPSTHPELEPGQQGVTSDQVNNWNAAATDASTAKTTASTSYQLATSALQKAQAALPAAGGTLTGTVSSATEIILRSDMPDRNTWAMHNSQNNNLYIAPTATRGGGDYQWGKGLVIGQDNVWWAGGDLNSLKSSVASGKSAIISALSAQGVQAASADEFSDLAAKIRQIGAKVYECSWNTSTLSYPAAGNTQTIYMQGIPKPYKCLRVQFDITAYYNNNQASIGGSFIINWLSGSDGYSFFGTVASCSVQATLDTSSNTIALRVTPPNTYNGANVKLNNFRIVA